MVLMFTSLFILINCNFYLFIILYVCLCGGNVHLSAGGFEGLWNPLSWRYRQL